MMTLQEAFELYKANKLTSLNRQQYAVLQAYEAFSASDLVWVSDGFEVGSNLARLWQVAIGL